MGCGASLCLFPTIRPAADWVHQHFGWIPFFSTSLSGPGMLPAALVLTIMVLPTVSAISRDALSAVPPRLREAAFGMGATRWEAILRVILPTASTGIFGALMLGFGRALGETMALAMLVGNSNQLSHFVVLAGQYASSSAGPEFSRGGQAQEQVLMYAALLLMAITLLVNICGAAVLRRATAAYREERK